MPEAEIVSRHVDAHVSGDPSAYNAKRMGDELSAFPPTGSSAPELANAPPRKGNSARARHADASMLGTERDDNLYSMLSRIGALQKRVMQTVLQERFLRFLPRRTSMRMWTVTILLEEATPGRLHPVRLSRRTAIRMTNNS
jgi:hypothetical protein